NDPPPCSKSPQCSVHVLTIIAVADQVAEVDESVQHVEHERARHEREVVQLAEQLAETDRSLWLPVEGVLEHALQLLAHSVHQADHKVPSELHEPSKRIAQVGDLNKLGPRQPDRLL